MLVVILCALFASVALQKVVRDKPEGLAVPPICFELCWVSVIICIGLLAL